MAPTPSSTTDPSTSDPLSLSPSPSPLPPPTLQPSNPHSHTKTMPPSLWAPLIALLLLVFIIAVFYISRWKARRIRNRRRWEELKNEQRGARWYGSGREGEDGWERKEGEGEGAREQAYRRLTLREGNGRLWWGR